MTTTAKTFAPVTTTTGESAVTPTLSALAVSATDISSLNI